jgi:tetratricopeptide (TPR) repeat protein
MKLTPNRRLSRPFSQASILALALSFLSAGARAQQSATQNIDQQTAAPARTEQTQAQAAKAADEATRLEASEADMSITYDQILERPDDVELNYRYARAQIARGELKNAGATLERVLLVNPDLAKVRLLYAVVLLRLDSLVEAQRELETIQNLPMPDSLRQEIEQYLALVKKRRKNTHLAGSVSMGMEDDDNRASRPATNQMLFGNAPVTLAGVSGTRQNDASTLFMGNIGLNHDLGYQAGHTVFVNYSYYRSEQAAVKILNLQAHTVGIGGTFKSDIVNVTPTFLIDQVDLDQLEFLRDRGFNLRFDHLLNPRTLVYMEFKDMLQIYMNTQDVPNATDRNGSQLDFLWGVDYQLNPKMKIGASVGYTIKTANSPASSANPFPNEGFDSFERNTINLHHEWMLPRGMFLLSNASYNHDSYDEPDVAVSSEYRTDDWFRISSTFGAPLSLLNKAFKDFMGTLSYEYFMSLSSIDNYSYTNNKITGLVTYRWDAAF